MLGWSWAFLACSVPSILVVSAERLPQELAWTDDTYGPDGPWRAVSVRMGPQGKHISLYPGGTWETWLIEDDYCDKADCYASKAGLYDSSSGDTGGIGLDGGLRTFMLGLDLEGDPATRYMDDVTLSLDGGDTLTAENVSLVLLKSQRIRYPGGRKVPFFAGCLSLGANRVTQQSFTQEDGPAINASIVPGWMWENEWTPSNSFGMHIGSVQPAMPGSLWIGGYDQNRVAGDVLSLSGGPRDGITLWDLAIDVVGGKSPFDFNSKQGLLASGNSSIVNGLKVSIDACSPYLTLPKSTCDSIAANLPVKFDDDLGLYLWDTKSDKYKGIVGSATALSFSFIAGSNTDPVKIRVPFTHLNLTLSAPLVDTPTPYFPCHVNENGKYVLGRAFLQDAFVGANWHPDANTWWLAQAPGRSIQATANVISIQEKDKTIKKGGNDWEASWKGVWNNEDASPAKATPSTSSGGNHPTETTNQENNSGTPDNDNEESNSSLSNGAKAGIGAGVGTLALIIGLGAFLFFRRRRNQANEMETTQIPDPKPVYSGEFWKPPQDLPPQELPAPGTHTPVYHEAGPGQPDSFARPR